MSEQMDLVLSSLSAVGCDYKPYMGGYLAKCPSHNDTVPSLKIDEGDTGIVFKCFALCEFHQVLRAIGLKPSEVFYNTKKNNYSSSNYTPQSSSKSTNAHKGKETNKTQDYPKKQEKQFTDNPDYSSVRFYNSLEEYANFKGVSSDVFINADAKEEIYQGHKVIAFQTQKGKKYRFLGGKLGDNLPKFKAEKGFSACWYKLKEAFDLCIAHQLPLVICNGEPSTIIAQSVGIPASCLAGGESKNLTADLASELQYYFNTNNINLQDKEIIIAFDNDDAGIMGAKKRVKELTAFGFNVKAIQFVDKIFKGYDLADFVKLNKENTLEKFLALPSLSPAQQNPTAEAREDGECMPGETDEERKKREAKEKKREQEQKKKSEQMDKLLAVSIPIANLFQDLTDIGNAQYMLSDSTKQFRYCFITEKWYWYDDTKWVKDVTGKIFQLAEESTSKMVKEAMQVNDADVQEIFQAHAKSSRSDPGIQKMIKRARNQEGIPVLLEDFDKDQWVINCQNGTLDLKTFEFRDHTHLDYITKITNTSYDPDAKCPTWLAFLDRIMAGNQNIITFLQKIIGYSLTGDTTEKALFFFYGSVGDNGKTTFMEAISEMFGTYALPKFPISALLEDYHGSSKNADPNIAQLDGVRFVSGSEISGNKKFNEETIKDLTGGQDTISGKRLYENPFTFKPTHKLFVYGNEKPPIRSTSNAMWNRLKTIPFEVSIPKAEQDPKLANKLRDEFPGILTWAVEGCKLWQREGLNTPEEIKKATDEYRGEMDILAMFISECVFTQTEAKIRTSTLYQAYTMWCKETCHKPYSTQSFSRELVSKGYEKYKNREGIFEWRGIGLKQMQEVDELIKKLHVNKSV